MDSALTANPTWKSLSKTALFNRFKSAGLVKNKKEYDAWIEASDVAQGLPFNLEQVPNKKQSKRLAVAKKIAYPSYSFQIDIALPGWKSSGTRQDRFLILTEVNSRKVYVAALANGKMNHVAKVYRDIMEDDIVTDIPLYAGEDRSLRGRLEHVFVVHGDKYFNSAEFRAVNDDMGISVNATTAADDHKSRTGNVLGIVDASIKTIKKMLFRYYQGNNDAGWVFYLQKIVDEYNKTPHSSLKGSTPTDMYQSRHELARLFMETSNHNKAADEHAQSVKHPIDTKVRLIRDRAALEKGGARLSKEVYIVTGHPTSTTYKLVDAKTGVELKRRPRITDVVRASNIAREIEVSKRGKEPTPTQRRLRKEVGVGARRPPRRATTTAANPRLDDFEDSD